MNLENISPQDFQLPPNSKKLVVPIIIVIIALILIFTSFYTVGPDEVGVVRRLGKYVRTTESGLHFLVPFNIEKVDKVKVDRIHKEEFGFRTISAGVQTTYSRKDYSDESLLLTGDLNITDVEWIVQYKIKDPVHYLFRVRNVEDTIRDVSESVMREVVGDRGVSEVLTVGRVEIGVAVQESMQDILDEYKSGIEILTVKLQDVNPPDPVKPSFNEVNQAKQEREKMINQAKQAYNKAIPKARGEANKMVQAAEGYALDRVNRSQGDASRFEAIYTEYRKSQDITKRRIFLETLQKVIPNMGEKILVDDTGEGLLKLLNVSELKEKGGTQQ